MCIGSVVRQSYRDLEILLIDDGSPDECPRICDAWADRDDRIRVVHRENAGLGAARNLGMALARGEYLCFLDSDDFLEERAIEKAREIDADVVVFGFSDVDLYGNLLETFVPRVEKTYFQGTEVREELLPMLLAGSRKMGLFPGVCWSLFSVQLLRRANWRFPSEREIICEDIYALLKLYQSVENAAVLPAALYNYRKNGQTLSRRYREDRFEKGKLFLEKAWELCENAAYSERVKDACIAPFLGLALAAMKQERGRRLREMIGDSVFQEALGRAKPEGWKKRILYRAMERKWYYLCEILLIMQRKWG